MIHLFTSKCCHTLPYFCFSLCKFQLLLLASVSEMACVCVGWCLQVQGKHSEERQASGGRGIPLWIPVGFNSHDWCISHLFYKGLPMETQFNWHYSSDLLQWCFNRPRLWVSWAGAQLLCCLMWLWERKKKTLKSFFPGRGKRQEEEGLEPTLRG